MSNAWGRHLRKRAMSPILPKNRESKYHSRKTLYNNEWYDSKREAEHAKHLDLMRKSVSNVLMVVKVERQIVYELPGGIKYKLDFRVTYADGHIEYHEVKGHWTPVAKLKMKLMKEKYPEVKICIIK